MKLSLSLTSIIVIVLVTLNGCSKTESPKAVTAPVQVVTPITPPIIGEFVESNQGDYSCGLKIRDVNGKETDLSATFNICDDPKILKGNVYKFSYKIIEVPDCDCQGNEECNNKCKITRKEESIDSAELVSNKVTSATEPVKVEATITLPVTGEFTCKTEKHTIIITKAKDNNYQYKSWNKPKLITEKADIELISSELDTTGGSNKYTFKTGKTEYSVSDQWSRSIDDESRGEGGRRGATGDLWISINGKVKSHYYCYK